MTPADLRSLAQTIIRLRDGCEHEVEFGLGKMFEARCPKCDRIVEKYPEPGLCDVLLALSASTNYPRIDWCLSGAIELVMPTFFVEREITSARWNLRDDRFSVQSPDMHRFLASLLL